VHIVLVVFIIIAGFAKSDRANLQPLAPKGARGIFNGAAVVFFRCARAHTPLPCSHIHVPHVPSS